ncbi:integrase/recombinase XerC [Prevotella communis]|uniref:Integrase/recombinase XerC n=1 Tax=Prevotella communis TaxID=2913614 RepID=A0A1H0CW78_9BACT|nr:tyrosine-type recombinase/integrase [Prevotella communis]SDN62167.1 integrase/recombinase XerC [Prevotella communis]
MIDQFLDYLRYERNRSELTVKRYEGSLRDFQKYFEETEEGLSWVSVDADVIRGWMESLMDRGNNASTVNTGLSALRSFFRYALARKLVNKDPAHMITGPKKRKPLPQFVKEEEINQLLDKTEWGVDYKDVRARTIIIILYEAGLRRSELIGLNDSDVDLDAMQLKVTGKRNKQRIIPFGKELAEQLGQYIACRDEEIAKRSEALFLNNKGERISEAEVYNTVRENLAKVTTLKKKSPHVLRHSFATAMLNHDAGLESVRKLLGHESLETTQIYTHTTFEQLKRVYKEALPRD